MNIFIGENIKRLRLQKNITQEKLAVKMNVSTQAVSKWERGETLPDISMIIPLASYFGTTTDNILGFDEAKTKSSISKYFDEYDKLKREAKWDESVELIKKAHKEFPNSFEITIRYLYDIIGNNADNPKDIVLEKSEELTTECERIIDECTIDHIRRSAIDILAKVEKAKGNLDKAFALLDRLPEWYGCTKYQKMEQLFDKKTDEWWHYVNFNFYTLSMFSINKLLKIIWFSDKGFDEKVKNSLRITEYLNLIMDETQNDMILWNLQTIYDHIGAKYHFSNKDEESIKYFDMALSCAVKFDEFILSDKQIENTTNKFKIDIFTYHGSTVNWGFVKRKIEWYGKGEWYKELQKSKHFNDMLDKYRPFAKDIK